MKRERKPKVKNLCSMVVLGAKERNTMGIMIRKARLSDAEMIANFVNSANPARLVTGADVTERFSQVGFLVAHDEKRMVGLIGWRVENLVICVTDFLIAPEMDRFALGRELVRDMEKEGELLQAEAVLLFLPVNPSQKLLDYWQEMGYTRRAIAELPKPWQEAAREWSVTATEAMVHQIREELVRRPL